VETRPQGAFPERVMHAPYPWDRKLSYLSYTREGQGVQNTGAIENIIAMFFFTALDPVYAVTYSSGNKHTMFPANIDDRRN